LSSWLTLVGLAFVNGLSAFLYASIFLAVRGTWATDLTKLLQSPAGWRDEQFILIASGLLGAVLTPELAARLRRLDGWPSKAALVSAARQGVWRGYAVVFGSCALLPVFLVLPAAAREPRFALDGGLVVLILGYALVGGIFWAVMTTPIVILGGSANALLTAFVAQRGVGSVDSPGQRTDGVNAAAAEQSDEPAEARG